MCEHWLGSICLCRLDAFSLLRCPGCCNLDVATAPGDLRLHWRFLVGVKMQGRSLELLADPVTPCNLVCTDQRGKKKAEQEPAHECFEWLEGLVK